MNRGVWESLNRDQQVEWVAKHLEVSRLFAVEYLMERRYNGLSHSQAMDAVNEKLKEEDR